MSPLGCSVLKLRARWSSLEVDLSSQLCTVGAAVAPTELVKLRFGS